MGYEDIFGQESLITRLKEFGEFFISKGTTPGHILLTGEDGTGKATIAETFAREQSISCRQVDARKLEAEGLIAVLTNLRQGEVLNLTNIHVLRKDTVARLSNVLLENKLTITIGQGHAARKHVMDIKPFTLIGTCPKKADCPQELMKEFSLVLALQPYSTDSLQAIASNNAKKLGAVLELGAAGLISSSSDGRPGSVESLLRRVLKAVNKDVVTADDVAQAFKVFGIKASADMPTNGYGNIQNLSGVDFEKLITNLLVRMGFQAEMTRTSGDGGIDIVAMLDKPIIGGRYLFQCKRFAPDNLIGAPTLRDFYGAVTADRAVKGVFITTSDFTTQAKDFAQKSGLELINLGQLQRLLQEYGLIDTQAV